MPTEAARRGAVPAPDAIAAGLPQRPHAGVDHLLALYVQTPATLTGSLFGIVLVSVFYWPLAEAWRLLGWLGVISALWLVRLGHYLRFRRQRTRELEALRVWRRSWMGLVLCQGAMWGLAAWLFWHQIGRAHV